MFILRAEASGTEMLILLLYFNSSSIGFTYCYSLEHKLQYNFKNNVFGDPLVLLVQRSTFQTPKRRQAGADLFKYWCHRPLTFKFTASSKLEMNYPATSVME